MTPQVPRPKGASHRISQFYRNFQKGGVTVAGKANTKTIAQNKKAYHDYFVEESFEAGIELKAPR